MVFNRKNWQDNVSDIMAAELNRIEQGIYDNSLVVDAVTDKLNPTDTETYKTAELTEGQITDVIGVSDIVIKGQTEQDGTPTPSAPVDVNVVSGSNVINTSNKNIWYCNEVNTTKNGLNIKIENNKIILNGTASALTDLYVVQTISGTINNKSQNILNAINNNNGQYVMSNNSNLTMYFFDSNNQYISKTIIITDERKVKEIFIRIPSGTSFSNKDIEFQLEKRSTSSSYLPHQGKELPLDLPVENLFDKDNSSLVFNGFANRSSLKLDSNASAKTICQPCKPNTTYTISKILSARFFVDETSSSTISNGISITPLSTGSSSNVTSHTVTTSASAKYLLIYYYVSSADTLSEEKIRSSIQIEQGSKANAYTPYGTNPIELCKIGNYQDYFYRDNNKGKWYLHKEINKKVLNGSENWQLANSGTSNYYYYYNLGHTTIQSSSIASTHYPYAFISNSNTEQGILVLLDGNIRIRYGTEDTVANFKTWLANNNVSVYYPLATPTNTEITDTILISQLEAIYNAPLYEETNITQENNDLPMVLDITACKDNINGIKAFIRK